MMSTFLSHHRESKASSPTLSPYHHTKTANSFSVTYTCKKTLNEKTKTYFSTLSRNSTCNSVALNKVVPLSSNSSSSENQSGFPNVVGSISRYLIYPSSFQYTEKKCVIQNEL